MNERRFRRVPFDAEVRLAAGGEEWRGHLLDIALRGALLECDPAVPLPTGTPTALSIPLPGSEIALDFEAELVHREENRLGFRFLHLDLATFTHLRALLALNSGDADGIRNELPAWLKG